MKHSHKGFAGKLMAGTALAMLAATAAQAQNETVTITGTTIRGQQPVGANLISVDRQAIEASGAQTTAQLLVTIPQLNNFGSAAQGGQNSSDGTGTQAPTIHSLGNSASNQTLVLIDGHRLPLTGLNHNLVDPSVIPTSAISNVEVLPDGASAIYGSDAVAGVLNFHTRKDYSGWETAAQVGIADHYSTFNISQLFGHSWDTGGVVATYNYSSRSNLMNINRDFITTRQDIRLGAATTAQQANFVGITDASSVTNLQTTTPSGAGFWGYKTGGTPVPYPSLGGNFQNTTSCPVATISNSSANSVPIFAYPYLTSLPRQTSLQNNGPSTGICDTGAFETALPSEVRNQALVAIRQSLNDKLSMNVDAIYASRMGSDRNARGGPSNVAVWSPYIGTGGPAFGSNQRNPFYMPVPGSSQASEFVSMSLQDLLSDQGLGYSSTKTGQITALATFGLDYDIGGDWLLSLGGTSGTDFSFSRSSGGVNTAEQNLALNGTTQTAGTAATTPNSSVYADPFGLGNTVSVTRALTTANALDVWHPKATNQTNPTVLRSLVDSATNQTSTQNLQNITLHADGPIGDFWGAGPIKAAFGGEWVHYYQAQRNATSNGSGPNSTSARTLNLESKRTVYAAYAEFVVPVVGPDMGIPLMQRLTFDFAGRYDHYNDFGDTRNPKIAFNWDIIDGIRATGSFGTSFTAPALDSIGQPGTGVTGETNIGASNSGAANNLVVLFTDTRAFSSQTVVGGGIGGTFVSNAFACAAAGSSPVSDAAGNTIVTAASGTAIGCKIVNTNGGASQGLTIGGGFPGLRPQLGQSYSANLVFDFGKIYDLLDGLTTQVTYYQAKITGAVTNIGIVTNQTNVGIPYLTTFGPANCNSAASCALTAPGWDPSDPYIQALLPGRPLNNPLPPRVYSIQDNRQQNAYALWQNGIDFNIGYRLATDSMGDFTFSLSGNQILRASQKNGPSGVVFNTVDGNNSGRFANIELTGVARVNWHMDPITVGVAFNYQHPYWAGVTTFPYNLPGPVDTSTTCGFTRCSNAQHISALQVIDLTLAYDLPDDLFSGMSSGTNLNVNITNLFDSNPPFQNNSGGAAGGNIIGRTITIGVRKKW